VARRIDASNAHYFGRKTGNCSINPLRQITPATLESHERPECAMRIYAEFIFPRRSPSRGNAMHANKYAVDRAVDGGRLHLGRERADKIIGHGVRDGWQFVSPVLPRSRRARRCALSRVSRAQKNDRLKSGEQRVANGEMRPFAAPSSPFACPVRYSLFAAGWAIRFPWDYEGRTWIWDWQARSRS
jgi:hypothetical protein